MQNYHDLDGNHGLGDCRPQDGHYRLAALDDVLHRRVCLLGDRDRLADDPHVARGDHDRLPNDHHGLNGHGYYGHARLVAGDDDLAMRHRQL